MAMMPIPEDIIQEIGLSEPKSLKNTAQLIYDSKQYSIKIPVILIEEMEWQSGDNIQITIKTESLKLTKKDDSDE